MTLKKIGKALLAQRMERQVRSLRQKNKITVIAVCGSVGKTSTKLAIAKTLSGAHRVKFQEGNYNDRLTVPLVFFGHEQPGIYNLVGWRRIIRQNRKQLAKPYPYDTVVVELGTDAPGQLKEFSYLQPDIMVLTAIADEHMEYFKTLKAVAAEELVPVSFSEQILVNADDVPPEYIPQTTHLSYGLEAGNYTTTERKPVGLQGQQIAFRLPSGKDFTAQVAALGDQGAKIVLAAVAVADMVGMSATAIKQALKAVTPVSGRMQILAGKRGSIIIDDTYNASPVAVEAALDVLYNAEATQRIAILGSMNELGDDSPTLHSEIGGYCDPGKLDLVVTIGKEAADYLAPVAKNQGCKVQTFMSPYDAGRYVAEHVRQGAVVLAKGSQNGVFAEEAVKILLANQSQARKLVRQSAYWMAQKEAQFPNT
ncbi:MAG TPA: Mur ligase family protein [Candidatus Saccharimonadales bacterium]|nr:Mur ligase family protein [Candidatus Saccharimonadales bacterium]